MKNLFATLFLCCPFIAAKAQHFYLAPSIGFGISSVKTSNFMVPPDALPIFSFNPEVSVGYRINKFTVSAGLGGLRTGYREEKDITMEQNGTIVLIPGVKFAESFTHLTIPVRVGYRFDAGPVFIMPQLGIDAAFNLFKVSASDITGEWEARKWESESFKEVYNGFSVFGVLQINVGLPLTDRLSVVGAPSFKYMLTNILDENVAGMRDAKQYNYAFLFHAGIMWDLGK